MSGGGQRPDLARLARVALGRGGLGLLALSWSASLAQALVEWGIAAFLVLFLHSRGLIEARALPRWLPLDPARAGPLGVWTFLFGLAAAYCVLQVAAYQSRIVLGERAHARLRLLLGDRMLLAAGTLPLSRASVLTGEVFPRTAAALVHSIQLGAFVGQAVMLTLAMLYLAPRETLIGLAGLGVLGGLVLYLNRLNNRVAAALPAIHAALEQWKVRVARNWLFIRALRLEEQEHRRWVDACRGYYRSMILAYFFGNLGGALAPVLVVLVIAVIALASSTLFGTAPANLVAFLYLFFRLQHMLANGSHLVGGLFTAGPHVREAGRLVGAMPAGEVRRALIADRELAVLRSPGGPGAVQPVDDPATSRVGSGTGRRPERPPALAVRDLAFAWPGDPRPLFDGLWGGVRAGGQLGVVGANGTGKSTLLAILLGCLDPARGAVLLDGIASGAYVSRHAPAVGYVGPEPYLVAGSIRDNLAYGLERPGPEGDLLQALEEVRLAPRVRSLPHGLDHRIEEQGEGLSAGERQKLAIARALLRRPRLLVLDEPTANVDEESERDVAGCLSRLKGRCTVVIVSHRPPVLRNADDILSLDDARGGPGDDRWLDPAAPGPAPAAPRAVRPSAPGRPRAER